MNTKLFENDFIKLKINLILELNNIHHPDSSRVAKEIIQYLVEKYPGKSAKDLSTPLNKITTRLENNEPWEYIRGWAEFCGNKFFVDSNVLIPRPETEDLVNLAVKEVLTFTKKNPKTKLTIVDVGTGSGCIITSIERQIANFSPALLQQINFVGTDINEKSLVIAKKNAKQLDAQINFVKTNLIEDLQFDTEVFIVANLPYIPSEVCQKLDKSVLDYEPYIALDGGENGTKYYEELLSQLNEKQVKPIGMLWEIDPLITEDIKRIYQKGTFIKDFTGKIRFANISR